MELKKKDKNSREVLQRQFNNARSNLLLMLAFTVINIIIFVLGAETMFIFSATVPFYAIVFGVIDPIILEICIAIAVISVGGYLLCWLLSKKHYGWMIGALVMFVIDTLVMIWLYSTAEDASGILDFVGHVWVLWYLVIGVISGVKLKKLPQEVIDGEAQIVEEQANTQTENKPNSDS